MSNNEVNRCCCKRKKLPQGHIFDYSGWNGWSDDYNTKWLCAKDRVFNLQDPKEVIPEIHRFLVYEPDFSSITSYYIEDIDIPIDEIRLNFIEQVVL